MRLLFVALTRHQYSYFKTLSEHLDATSRVLFLPSPSLSFRRLFAPRIDTKQIVADKFREVDIKYRNPLLRRLYKIFLRLQIPLSAAAVERAIQKTDPDCVLLWNGKKFHQAIALQVARQHGRQCAFFENGLLPDTTQFDFKGVNASASVPRSVGFYRTLRLPGDCQLPRKLQARTPKRAEVPAASQEVLPEHYIFVPFQVAYDTQIVQHSPWISDMVAFFNLICTVAEASGRHFVIKEHPSDRVSDYTALRDRAPEHVHFSHANTQKLIENADAVVTINSTVGIEGLLFHKRVVVLGEAFFAIDGIVKTARSKEKLMEIIGNLDAWEPDRELIETFLKYLQCVCLVPGSWRNPTPRHYRAIETRLKERLRHV